MTEPITLGHVVAPPLVDVEAEEPQINVSDHFRYLDHWTTQKSALEDRAAEEIQRIRDWLTAVSAESIRKMEFHENSIRKWFQEEKHTKKQDYPHGSVRLQKGRERIEILDADSLPVNFLHLPSRPSPDKDAIKEYIKRTGIIPDQVDCVRGDDKIVVEVQEQSTCRESTRRTLNNA